MNEYKYRNRTPPPKLILTGEQVREFFRREGLTLVILATVFVGSFYVDQADLIRVAKSVLATGKNLFDWVVVGVVAVAILAFTWRLVQPFVCVALGVITCWVLWRLGLW
jgi:hypothetical protein